MSGPPNIPPIPPRRGQPPRNPPNGAPSAPPPGRPSERWKKGPPRGPPKKPPVFGPETYKFPIQKLNVSSLQQSAMNSIIEGINNGDKNIDRDLDAYFPSYDKMIDVGLRMYRKYYDKHQTYYTPWFDVIRKVFKYENVSTSEKTLQFATEHLYSKGKMLYRVEVSMLLPYIAAELPENVFFGFLMNLSKFPLDPREKFTERKLEVSPFDMILSVVNRDGYEFLAEKMLTKREGLFRFTREIIDSLINTKRFGTLHKYINLVKESEAPFKRTDIWSTFGVKEILMRHVVGHISLDDYRAAHAIFVISKEIKEFEERKIELNMLYNTMKVLSEKGTWKQIRDACVAFTKHFFDSIRTSLNNEAKLYRYFNLHSKRRDSTLEDFDDIEDLEERENGPIQYSKFYGFDTKEEIYVGFVLMYEFDVRISTYDPFIENLFMENYKIMKPHLDGKDIRNLKRVVSESQRIQERTDLG